MSTVNIPVPSAPVVGDNGLMTKPWYQLIQAIATRANKLTTDVAAAVDLTADVSGVLPVDNGGTGVATVTAYQPVVGGTTSTGAMQSVAAGTAGLPLVSKGVSAKPAYDQMTVTDTHSILIEYPQDKTYYFVDIPYGFTVQTVTTRTRAGTCTVVTKKNTTAITGLSNSASTTKQTKTATAGNVFGAGDDLAFTLSSTSSCTDLQITVKFTRDIP